MENVMAGKQYLSVSGPAFWKAFWLTMRPHLIFVSGAAGLVGLSFIENPRMERIVLGFIPLFFSYGLGQALTDCFQTDTDAFSSPYRPLIKGIISRNQVIAVSLIGLTLAVSILTYLNPVILVFGVMAVLGLLAYTRFKRRWWGGPPWNSWIVALLPVMGRLVDSESRIKTTISLRDQPSASFFLAVLAIFFAYANFVVIGYFKDISADRKTGYLTFPVVFGWKPAAVYSDITALAAASFTASTLYSIGEFNIFGLTIFITAVVINLHAQVVIHRLRDENKAYRPIANVVRAFILYCASVVVTLKAEWIIFLAVFYLFFEIALKNRPEKRQV